MIDLDKEECPAKDTHTPRPKGYLEYQAWADQMATTHDQQACPGCGRFKIWVPATDVCSQCSHPTSMHADVMGNGDTSCALPDCECLCAVHGEET